jgi:hypothetical protein
LQTNSELFSDLLHSDPLIRAKFVYSIDLANQTYLRSLGESAETLLSEIPSKGLEWAFHVIQNEVLSRRLDAMTLPNCIIELRQKAPPTQKQRRGESPKTPNIPSPSKKNRKDSTTESSPQLAIISKSVSNPKFNKAWLVSNDNYAGMHMNRSNTPTHKKNGRSVPFCLAYHTKGSCRRGKACTLSHEDLRDLNLESEFEKFVKPFAE